MASGGTREVLVVLLLLAASASAQLDWGTDRQVHSGVVSQSGIAADRTRGPDTAFVGLIASGRFGDTVMVVRTTDDGESWESVWETTEPFHAFSNLALRFCAGQGGWIVVMWLDRDSSNNGDIAGARISVSGGGIFPLEPVAPSRDTLTGLAVTRSFDSAPAIYVVWQDEQGRARPNRAPRISMVRSSDLGQSWSAPRILLDSFEMPAIDYGAPGHLYAAARSVATEDIAVMVSTDGGEDWAQTWLTSDTTAANDMFPSVACTHDSGTGERAWVSYDNYGSISWRINYAYTSNAGGLWVLGRSLASGTGNQFLASLDCAGYGSRRVRAAYASNREDGYHIYFRSAEGTNPSSWSSPLAIGDTQATNTMAPVVTSYGVSGDTLDKGLVIYAGLGPRDVWYDAQQFTGLSEANPIRGPGLGLRSVFAANRELNLRFCLPVRERVRVDLYAIDGQRLRTVVAGVCPAGNVRLQVPVAGLAAGPYLIRLGVGSETSVLKAVCVP